MVQVAAKALENAHGSAEKAEAKDAVKRALADAGVADADNAGTIAWANRNLKASGTLLVLNNHFGGARPCITGWRETLAMCG